MRCTGQEPALRLTGKEVCLGGCSTRRGSCRWPSVHEASSTGCMPRDRYVFCCTRRPISLAVQPPLTCTLCLYASVCIRVPCYDLDVDR